MTTFSIVIPTLNAQGHIEKLIGKLIHLTKAVAAEIIVIDSDSRDNTKKIVLGLIKEFPNIRFYKIGKKNFNHGLTRNLGVRLARGKYVCFVSQDALPTDETTFRYFLEDFSSKEAVVAVFAKDVPSREVANFLKLEHYCRYRDMDRLAMGKPLIQTKGGAGRYAKEVNYYGLSNVFSCYKKSFLLRHPFAKVPFGEDLLMGRLIIDKGFAKVYDPRLGVIHHQKISLWDYYHRQKHDLNLRLGRMYLKDKPQLLCKLKGIFSQKDSLPRKIYYTFELGIYYLVKLAAYL
jgi:rhamnosyltransferase